ncbi:MAG: TIR domain-containing protein [Alistipes sp.]|nr:TIR domain-containing protein [Alistipes sp.]
MAYDIFISYRRKDSAGLTSGTNIARTIKQQLEIEGYKNRVFFDYSELSDDEFEKIILTAIEQCKVFVLVLSRDSMMRCANDGDWVRREICHAQKCGLKIIPIEPDNLFNGYPESFPSELDIIKRIQHTTIHMDSSFERDMRAMIDSRIAPVLSQQSDTPSLKGALVRIDSDLECKVLRYGEQIATVGKGMSEIRLPKGKHKISFVGVESDAERYDCIIDIHDLDYEEYVEVKLASQYWKRKGAEAERELERRRIARREKELEQERKAREEAAERARLEAEQKAREEAAERARLEAEQRAYEQERQAKLSGRGRNGIYKIGDYYNDGQKRGVVFEVDATGRHGKIISLTESSDFVKWALDKNFGSIFKKDNPIEYLIESNDCEDGMNNMIVVKQIKEWQSKYPAFKWCADLGREWYLPALRELYLSSSVHDTVNQTLMALGGKQLSYHYWTSTEYTSQYSNGIFTAWFVSFYNNKINAMYDPKNVSNLVRAVAKF